MGDPSVNKLLATLSITAAVGGLLCVSPTLAQPTPQLPPPAAKAQSVQLKAGPILEIAHDDTAILEWVTNNPGGSDDHFAVVQYGTSAGALTETAKSHIRLNRRHSNTLFRVRMDGLKSQTTYYFQVTSTAADGTGDGVVSDVGQFTTPAAGQRTPVAAPLPQN
jgi:hypothetical protein